MRGRLDPAPWPWLDRPRVLLENADEVSARESAELLRRSGYAVAVCHGPTPQARCPLACADGCALVEGADVVVTSLGDATPEAREVLQWLRLRYDYRPLVVEPEPGALAPEALLAAVRDAIAH